MLCVFVCKLFPRSDLRGARGIRRKAPQPLARLEPAGVNRQVISVLTVTIV